MKNKDFILIYLILGIFLSVSITKNLKTERDRLLENSDNLKRIEVIESRLTLLENINSKNSSNETKILKELKNSEEHVRYSMLANSIKTNTIISVILILTILIILFKNYIKK